MRGIGLLALLVGAAIMFYMWTQHTAEDAKVYKEVRPQMQQLSGHDESGRPINETYSLSQFDTNGHFHGLKVDKLDADSAMRQVFGLKEGDVIVQVSSHGAPFKAHDIDADMMKAYVQEAYQFKQPMVVERGGQTITLNPGSIAPNAPGASNKKDSNDVNSTLEGITNPR